MPIDPINVYDYEALAKERLTKMRYDSIAGGATDEVTIRRTRAAFDSIMLRPRMLVDVGNVDTSTTVLGQEIKFPIMLDPAGRHGIAHSDGELATVRAAGKEGTLLVNAYASSYGKEEVAREATGPIWSQQYLFADQGYTRELAHSAAEAGYSGICVTLDTRVSPKRERNLRNERVREPVEGTHDVRNPLATWQELEWLTVNTHLPVIAKGIMTGEDARLCTEHGVKGLIVSNHGGRQLDNTFATTEVLPEVVEAAGDRLEVYLDGGIRRGADVVKALALGARAVFIGRPLFWGLAVNGEDGVRAVLQLLREELVMTMGMCGRPTIESIDRSLIGTVSPLLSAFSETEALRFG